MVSSGYATCYTLYTIVCAKMLAVKLKKWYQQWCNLSLIFLQFRSVECIGYKSRYGEVSERLIEPVSKTGVPFTGTAGSNPALSGLLVVRRVWCVLHRKKYARQYFVLEVIFVARSVGTVQCRSG